MELASLRGWHFLDKQTAAQYFLSKRQGGRAGVRTGERADGRAGGRAGGRADGRTGGRADGRHNGITRRVYRIRHLHHSNGASLK